MIALNSVVVKKTFNIIPFFLSAFFILFLISPQFSYLYAASPKKKLTEIEKKIKLKKKRVKEAIKKERSILSKINSINKNISKQEKEIKNVDKLISGTQLRILGISKDLNALTRKVAKREIYLKKRLNSLYKQQYGGYALVLFKARDYQDLITKSKYISLAAHHDSRLIQSYQTEMNDIDFKKKEMEVQRNKLEKTRKKAKTKKGNLKTDLLRKDKLLTTIRSKRSTYEKTIRELEESSKRLQEMIKKLEKQKITGDFAGKKFRTRKGRLPWPINGKVLIPFGKYKDPKFNITTIKNGIEIRGQRGDRPRAVAEGKVVYADWFKGYGLLLIVNHGSGYHSLYGNLSEIFHSVGDIISKGRTVGRIGISSLLDVPALYFEIRYKGKPVNPIKWLTRNIRGKKKL